MNENGAIQKYIKIYESKFSENREKEKNIFEKNYAQRAGKMPSFFSFERGVEKKSKFKRK